MPQAASPEARNKALIAGLLHWVFTFLGLLIFVDAWPYWKDAGQLMAAYGTAGMPHPTGFPLAASLGRAVSLLPLGTMAFRMNLLSAGAAAVTSTTLFVLVSGTGSRTRRLLAWAVAWSFLAARTVWFHSVTAEVYLPSTALTVVLMAVALRSLLTQENPHRARTLRVLALGAGLASGLHVTALAAALGALVLVAACSARRLTWPLALQCSLLLAAGFMIQWYLPIRDGTPPWNRLAEVSGLSGWWAYATGRTIRSAFGAEIGVGSGALLDNAAVYGAQMMRQAGPALLLAMIGLVQILRRSAAAGGLLAAAWGGDLVFSVLINPMGQREFQTGLLSLFVIFLCAGEALSVGLGALRGSKALQGAAAVVAGAGLLIAPAISFPAGHRHLGANGLPYRYGLACLRALPPGSLVMTTSDDASGLLLYHQLLENRRRDSLNLVVQNLAIPGLIKAQAARYGDLFFPASILARQEQAHEVSVPVEEAVDLNIELVGYNLRRHNPVFWQSGIMAFEGVVMGHLEPGFPLSRVRVEPDPSRGWGGVLEAWRTWRAEDPEATPDPMGEMVLGDVLGVAGARQVRALHESMARGEGISEAGLEAAAALFRESLDLYDLDCRAWSNFAALQGLQGRMGPAAAAAGHAVELCPLHAASRANLVRFRILSGDLHGGLAAAREILDLPNRDEIKPRLERLARDLEAGGMGEVAAALLRLLD